MKPTRIWPTFPSVFHCTMSLFLIEIVALDGHNGIEALVVGRTIDVDAHRLAVAGEGVAIGAGGHVVENGVAFCLANIAKTPLDEMDG